MMNGTDIAEIITELERQGFEINAGSNGQWEIHTAGHLVATLPTDPSDQHGVRNAIAVLRRAGFIWPS